MGESHKYIHEIEYRFRKKRVRASSPIDRPIVDVEDLLDIFHELQHSVSEKLIGVCLDSKNMILAYEIMQQEA